jgi:hypothetical protein
MELPAADARESRGLRSRVKIDLDFLLCLPTVLTAIDRKGRVRCVAAFCGNQVEQAKSPVASLRFVGVAVDEAGMAVDKIVDHMSGIQRARRVIHRRVPPRSYGVAILNNLSIEYFPVPVMYSSKKPPIMLRFLKKLSIPSTRSVPVIVQ